jgi:hypothetical protein
MLSVNKRKIPYDISSSVPASFEIDFPYWDKSQISAVLVTPAGDVDLVQDTDYTLSDPGSSGTLTRVGTWDPTATLLMIFRTIDIVQTIVDLANGAEIDADIIELGLDELVAMMQQLSETIDRVVRFPVTETTSSPDMPSAAERALQFLAFDETGRPISTPGSAGEFPVSSFMGPVIASGDALTAHIKLGLLPTGAAAAISALVKTLLAAATVLDMQKAAGIVPSGAAAAISAAMQAVLATPGAGWTSILQTDAGSGWATALAANASDLAAALAAGKGWRPVGDLYEQGPFDAAPWDLFIGTWTNVSYEEAGLATRIEGRLAGNFGGATTPARLSVSVSGGVPAITIVSGGAGYLSGGAGSLPLIIAGGCTTQMVANATVINGVLTAINVTTAGGGYTSGKVAVYDGVIGYGDLVMSHKHVTQTPKGNTVNADDGATCFIGMDGSFGTSSVESQGPIGNGLGAVRSGAETTVAYIVKRKYRRTA